MPITGFVSCSLGVTLPSVIDPATSAWVVAVVGNGGSVSNTRQTLVNNLISGLKSDGVWSKLDRLWVLAAENQPSALTDMVALVLATAVGSPAFAADRGYTGVDSSATVYIDTNTNLSTFGGLFGTNAGHISSWSNTDAASSATGGGIMGVSSANGGSGLIEIFPLYFGGNTFWNCNGAGIVTAEAHSLGHYVANRSNSTSEQAYNNGSNTASTTSSPASVIPSVDMVLLAVNDSTVGINFGGGYQVTMSSIGSSLSGTDVLNFYNRLRTYMSAVGVP